MATATTTTTKCDIIRDVARAGRCGLCAALPEPPPAGCAAGGRVPPGAVCGVANAANTRMRLFARRYAPAGGAAARARRRLTEADYEAIIRKSEADLAAAYPGAAPAATAVSWPDLERCLRDPAGARGGPGGGAYFTRSDAVALGMAPEYPLGGARAEHAIWRADSKKPSPLPLSVDYVMNPDLFAIVMLAVLALVLGALLLAAARGRAGRRGPPADPRAQCRAYVEWLDARGYPSDYYRKRCGLPPAAA